MNQRNVDYISRYNPRHLFPLVDDKLRTKHLAIENKVSVPKLIGVVESQHHVQSVIPQLLKQPGFCIKPAKGSGGKGILVITKVEESRMYRSNGTEVDTAVIKRHLSNVLAGLFSLGGATDVALIESLIEVDPSLKPFSHEGVPDIRVIVFKGIPVMAMMRLSCAASQGKANLHQGAIGVGIDIGTGKAVHAVQKDEFISQHEDTGQNLLALEVPHWDRLLELACDCFEMSGLGYLGVDLVIDAKLGPILLELNARPGLSIQIANNAGLLPRLRMVESLKKPERWTTAQKVQYAKQKFSVLGLGDNSVESNVSPLLKGA